MYDARSRTGGETSNLVFGLATLAVVGGAFLAVWKGPDLMGAGGPASPAAAVSASLSAPGDIGSVAMSPQETRFLSVISRLSPETYRELALRLPSVGQDQLKRMEVMFVAAYPVLIENADHLGKVSVRDIDRLTDTAIKELRKFQQSGTKWCKGSFLARFEGKSTRQAANMVYANGLTHDVAAPIALTINAEFYELIERARTNPTHHGKLTAADEQALQGAVMSLMADPSVMKAMMAGGNQSEALKQLNVCSMGVTALRSFRRLPGATKGRAWAAMFDHPDYKRAIREAERMF